MDNTINTITVTRILYENLVRDSEQLRILKNFIKDEHTYKGEIEKLIKAMEEEQ